MCKEIKPDTSLYTDMPSRLRAAALVAEACAAGKTVQYTTRGKNDIWQSLSVRLAYIVDSHDYRIKPEPREWWVNEYPDNCFSDLYNSRYAAVRGASRDVVRCLKVREVLD